MHNCRVPGTFEPAVHAPQVLVSCHDLPSRSCDLHPQPHSYHTTAAVARHHCQCKPNTGQWLGKISPSAKEGRVRRYNRWFFNGRSAGGIHGCWPGKQARLYGIAVLCLIVLTSSSMSCRSLTTGSAVKLTGVLAGSIGPGQDKELKVQSVDVVGQCDPEVCRIACTYDPS